MIRKEKRNRGMFAIISLGAIFQLGAAPTPRAFGAPPEVSPHATAEEKFVKGRIVLQPRAGVSDEEVAGLLAAHGGRTTRKIEAINAHVVELPENVNEKAIAALLNHHPKLQYADVDLILSPDFIPNDTYYPSSWHHPKIGSPSAWDLSIGSGVTIAILDSGVDSTHPDLAGHLVPGYNFYDHNTNTSDVYGHGTKTAGAAAAIGNNSAGAIGTAWNARIMPLRVTDTSGMGYVTYMADAITYAADHGARVASLSFQNPSVAPVVVSAADYMRSKGGIVFGGSGNTGGLDSTVNASSMVIVGATDGNDAKASWSTYGPSVDLAAPGVSIYTTVKGGGYGAASGTSFSTPISAGVGALMISANPALSGIQYQNLLFSTAKDLGASGWDQYFGHGRVDAYAAVQAAKGTVSSDTQAPSIAVTSPSSGAVVNGTVAINVAASDNVGVSRVELYAGGSLIASSTIAPFGFSWNTTSRPDGSVALMAKAYDAAGNTGASASVTVTVMNTVDSSVPVVSILSPANGAVVKNNVTISASATDNVSVKSMSLYIDGVLKASTTTGSISYGWNVRRIASGTHTIRVDARDASGNLGSRTISVLK